MENFESLTAEFKLMETRLTDMEEKIDSINTKLTQVVDAILGNPLTKSGGFIMEITILNKEIEALKVEIVDLRKKQARQDKFKDRVIWGVSLLIGGAALLQFAMWLYNTFSITK